MEFLAKKSKNRKIAEMPRSAEKKLGHFLLDFLRKNEGNEKFELVFFFKLKKSRALAKKIQLLAKTNPAPGGTGHDRAMTAP